MVILKDLGMTLRDIGINKFEEVILNCSQSYISTDAGVKGVISGHRSPMVRGGGRSFSNRCHFIGKSRMTRPYSFFFSAGFAGSQGGHFGFSGRPNRGFRREARSAPQAPKNETGRANRRRRRQKRRANRKKKEESEISSLYGGLVLIF